MEAVWKLPLLTFQSNTTSLMAAMLRAVLKAGKKGQLPLTQSLLWGPTQLAKYMHCLLCNWSCSMVYGRDQETHITCYAGSCFTQSHVSL